MIEQDGFLGIRFGQSLEIAHQRMAAEGFKFIGREKSEAPIGRVLYAGQYLGNEAKVHLDFLRNGFHRLRVEMQAAKPERVEDVKKEFFRKYGPSERLTRSRQACSDDAPPGSCFDMWALDDDTSIILDVAGSGDKPVIVLEFFRIL